MYNRSDPRIRRAINELSQTLESANESAQVGIWSFGHNYIRPCIGSVGRGLDACIAPCFPNRDDRYRRKRARSRGPESSFDFYDDWAADEWDNDEFERLLGEPHDDDGQPGRQRNMNYGSRGDMMGRNRAKSAVLPYDGGPDPTVIPKSSYFGFLTKLPFNTGGKGLKYKPSAADLKQVGHGRRGGREADIAEEEDYEVTGLAGRTPRGRRGTTASGHSDRTTDSYSSRGDIFPSDDEEYGDAVPLDDEFAMALERRTTSDDMSSGKRPRMSRTSTHAKSSRSVKRQSRPASTKSSSSQPVSYSSEPPTKAEPTMLELDQEEQRLRAEEEQEIERKREAAQKLARERGLSVSHEPQTETSSNPSSSGEDPTQTSYPFPILTPPEAVSPADEILESTDTAAARAAHVPISPPNDDSDDEDNAERG